MGFPSSRSLAAANPPPTHIRQLGLRSRSLLTALFTLTVAGGAAAADDPGAPQVVVTADFLQSDPDSSNGRLSTIPSSPHRTPIRRSDDDPSAVSPRTRAASPAATFGALGLILGAAYVVLLWLKRRGPGMHSTPHEAIDVLCSRRLDGQATLHLVRIGRKVLAVGCTASEVRTLAVVDEPEEIALLVSSRNQEPQREVSPRNLFRDGGLFSRNAVGKRGSRPPEQHPASVRKADVMSGGAE